MVVYEDFQCPHCASFDAATRDTVASYVEDGAIRVAYQPINYIDRAVSGATDYSMRAGNAATCVYEQAGGQAFHDQYAAYAKQAGAGGIGSCLSDLPHQSEIEERTRAFATSAVGANGTLSVVDGERLRDLSPAGLKAAIDEAAS